MTVRLYREADREACRQLWVELTERHRDLFEAPEIGGDDPGASFDAHLATVGTENIWVADVDEEVVGLVALVVEDTQAELEPIVVSAQHRGRGIGRELAETVIAEARSRGLRTVVARPVGRNVEAIRFFHACGLDVLDHVQLMLDLIDRNRWRPAETLAGNDFRA